MKKPRMYWWSVVDIVGQLHAMRLEQNMTRQQLADLAGMQPQNLYQYETGRRVPKIETVQRIAGALGHELTIALRPIV